MVPDDTVLITKLFHRHKGTGGNLFLAIRSIMEFQFVPRFQIDESFRNYHLVSHTKYTVTD